METHLPEDITALSPSVRRIARVQPYTPASQKLEEYRQNHVWSVAIHPAWGHDTFLAVGIFPNEDPLPFVGHELEHAFQNQHRRLASCWDLAPPAFLKEQTAVRTRYYSAFKKHIIHYFLGEHPSNDISMDELHQLYAQACDYPLQELLCQTDCFIAANHKQLHMKLKNGMENLDRVGLRHLRISCLAEIHAYWVCRRFSTDSSSILRDKLIRNYFHVHSRVIREISASTNP